MHLWLLSLALGAIALAQPLDLTAGVRNLIQRRLPNHVDEFFLGVLSQDPHNALNVSGIADNPSAYVDHWTVSPTKHGQIGLLGTSPIALAAALRYYMNHYLHADIYWSLGSTIENLPVDLPRPKQKNYGQSVVPLRYHFNTVTFSYTAAFWSWEDWELQLDWMALRGINLPLAWTGYEKILVDTLREYNFSSAGIASFLSGPAFQAWNRFGNIQGSWGGDTLPEEWIEGQFALQKKIIARMVELGMTPVLPAFTGFVPSEIAQIYPNASFVNGSQWNSFPAQYTNVSFLEPFDPLFAKMQKSFIERQQNAYGNVTNVYTLDQYNENDPYSGDLNYLKNVTKNTIAALKGADENAVWLLQGWLFFSSETFWTSDRVEAYLGGVADGDMLILDLFSESEPQWQRTNSYYGKPWIWCELHDYGGNMGLYGQVENVTVNPIEALRNKTSTMVGMGLTMEGQEGNEIMYDLLLDQAWSDTPLNSTRYFQEWISTRYNTTFYQHRKIYTAWDTLRQTVFNNTNLTLADAVTKSIFELHPNTTHLLNITGHHPTTIPYDPALLVQAWQNFYNASRSSPALWQNRAYRFDITDFTRQVLANAFTPLYTAFVAAANSSLPSHSVVQARNSSRLALRLLSDLDAVLAAGGEAHFSLSAWIAAARGWAGKGAQKCPGSKMAQYYEYNARNQITLWGPTGEITDYASKQWAGLIASYYLPRWQLFFEYTLNSSTTTNGANDALAASLLSFEEDWQTQDCEYTAQIYAPPGPEELKKTIKRVVGDWPTVFGI